MKKYFLHITIILLFSCKKEEGCMDPLATNYNSDATVENGDCTYNPISININFSQTVNQNPIVLNEMIYTNEANDNYSIQTVRYLISNIYLHATDTSVLIKNVHFIDIDNPESSSIIVNDIIDKNYTQISFTMGLIENENQTNLYLNEVFFPSFVWPEFLGGGYHYMQLEGDYNNLFLGYATHTGPTNGIDYSFTKNFNISTNIQDGSSITINMEINNWYSNPNTVNLYDGIMDNSNIQAQLQENGITDVFSIDISK